MARVNIEILGISELRWTGMGEFNSDDHYIYYCRQESLRRNGVAIMVNKRVRKAILGCNLKTDRMISVRFQGKPFNITVIQVYAPTCNVRFKNQGKSEVVKQEMARVNVNILGISELKWFEMGEFNSAAAANLLQSCPTLCDPIDCSPPGSPVPGILQARVLEWVAIAFSIQH